jgi:hypothetical protein
MSDEQIIFTPDMAWQALAGAILDGLPAPTTISISGTVWVCVSSLDDLQPWIEWFGLGEAVVSKPYRYSGPLQRDTSAHSGPDAWHGWTAQVSFIERVPDPPPHPSMSYRPSLGPAGLGVLDELAASVARDDTAAETLPDEQDPPAGSAREALGSAP